MIKISCVAWLVKKKNMQYTEFMSVLLVKTYIILGKNVNKCIVPLYLPPYKDTAVEWFRKHKHTRQTVKKMD